MLWIEFPKDSDKIVQAIVDEKGFLEVEDGYTLSELSENIIR